MKHKNRKLVLGVGINDADYVVQPTINGKQVMCPFYQAWKNMMNRCYDPKCHAKYPTYIGCTVVEEWHSFMAFRSWMVQQNWEGKHLDKDLLIPNNKVYGPDACAFVDSQTNTLLNDSRANRGDHPLGVHMHLGQYRAQLRVEGKITYLGRFETSEEAHMSYLTAKAINVMNVAYRQTDERVKSALIERSISMSDQAMGSAL